MFYMHTRIQNFRSKNRMCKVLNSTAIASACAGRDPQGGTSDGILFSKFSFIATTNLKSSQKESGRLRRWSNRCDIYNEEV